jgi:hypothetical protein
VVPLRSAGVVIGTVSVYNRRDGRFFSDHDLQLLQILGDQVVVGLDGTAVLEESRRNERALGAKNLELQPRSTSSPIGSASGRSCSISCPTRPSSPPREAPFSWRRSGPASPSPSHPIAPVRTPASRCRTRSGSRSLIPASASVRRTAQAVPGVQPGRQLAESPGAGYRTWARALQEVRGAARGHHRCGVCGGEGLVHPPGRGAGKAAAASGGMNREQGRNRRGCLAAISLSSSPAYTGAAGAPPGGAAPGGVPPRPPAVARHARALRATPQGPPR